MQKDGSRDETWLVFCKTWSYGRVRQGSRREVSDMRQVIRMLKVIRLETGEEPERFFDLEQENVESHQT